MKIKKIPFLSHTYGVRWFKGVRAAFLLVKKNDSLAPLTIIKFIKHQ